MSDNDLIREAKLRAERDEWKAVSETLSEMWEGEIARAETAEAERDDALTRLAAAEAQVGALVKERDEALWKAKCHSETLDAWFDRRKLGHAAVDHAVVDAASGYLRTSRVGGMSNKQSDLILGVIQDMARLGLFADLFARAALKGDDHE